MKFIRTCKIKIVKKNKKRYYNKTGKRENK